jgi:hypothetical protein
MQTANPSSDVKFNNIMELLCRDYPLQTTQFKIKLFKGDQIFNINVKVMTQNIFSGAWADH